jgi:hypothetical protein
MSQINSSIILLFYLMLVCGCNYIRDNKQNIAQQPKMIKKLSTDELLEKLQETGYFDYTKSDKLNLLKDSIRIKLHKHEFLTEFNQKSPYQSLDMRFYNIGDGEELYEENGVVSLINEMQPFLEKIGVHLDYSNDSYVGSTHTIVVNGRQYFMAQGSPLMWGETIAEFTEMINAELEFHKSKEKVYILEKGSYYLVFLTEEQYELINNAIQPDQRFLKINEWTAKVVNELKGFI